MTYVPLHHHSTYSMLDGLGFPDAAASRAAELGCPALGLTDHGNLFGAFDHYRACNKAGIKPIIGMEAYIAPDMSVRERVEWGTLEGKQVPGPYTHLTILAKNAGGLRNLYRLHARSYLEGYYYKPRLDFEALSENSEGLIVLSGCVGGEVAVRLRLGHDAQAIEVVEKYEDLFGQDYFLEVMDHGLFFDAYVREQTNYLSHLTHVPIVATNDSHYIHAGDARTHAAHLCTQTQTTLADPKRMKFDGTGYHVMSTKEMLRLHKKEHVHLSGEIAESIGSYDEVFEHRNLMPKGDDQLLIRMAWNGLTRLGLRIPEYEEQLEYELEVIIKLGYTGYCLALADIVGWAKRNGIFVGNGRGSGAGSLVIYCLGVTNLDPLYHGLLFERFLNYERQSPPDVDLDFESARRDEVIDYAISKYGEEFTCRILTLGTIATRRAILDAAKVLGREAKEAARIKALVPPAKRGRTLSLHDVKGLEDADPEVFKLASAFEGELRQPGIHPGGLIISPERLDGILPVKRAPKDPGLVSGFTMGEIEALGLVKFDLLGITTLDIIKQTLEFIEANSEDL